MKSRKSKDKSINEGVVGKYVKKDTPPELPGNYFAFYINIWSNVIHNVRTPCVAVINVWSLEKNKNKTKARRNSQQVFCGNGSAAPGNGSTDNSNTNANIIQATNQKFGTNGKITTKPGGLGHEGKYTPKLDISICMHNKL